MLENLLRLQLYIFCLILLAVAYFSTASLSGAGKHARSRLQMPISKNAKYFGNWLIYQYFVLSVGIIILADTVSWSIDGLPGTAAAITRHSMQIIYYTMHPAPLICYILYADQFRNREASRIGRIAVPMFILWAVVAIVALLSPFTGWLFAFDDQNRYLRGTLFPVFAAVMLGWVFLSFIPVTLNRKGMSKRTFFTLVLFPVPFILAAVLQALTYGTTVLWPSVTLFLVTAAINIQSRQAVTDHLTGLPNRRMADDFLAKLLKNGTSVRPFGGIMLDLDDFKWINDTLGHAVGDRALEDAARIVERAIGPADLAARYGGDEFLLIFPAAAEEDVERAVGQLQDLSEAYNGRSGRQFELSFSIGTARFNPAVDADAAAFLDRLDAAMYARKREKGGRKQGWTDGAEA